MYPEFTLFSEIQKQLTFHHHKTWRLLNKLRTEGKMRVDEDWMLRDKKLFVNMPRFYTELEALGQQHFIKEEFLPNRLTSDETKLTSDESEQNQSEIVNDESMPPVAEKPKSVEIIRNDLIADDDKRNHMSSDEGSGAKDKIITLLEDAVERAEKEATTLRTSVTSLLAQNEKLTQMTHLLVAPKAAEQGSTPQQPQTVSTEAFEEDLDDVGVISNHPTAEMV